MPLILSFKLLGTSKKPKLSSYLVSKMQFIFIKILFFYFAGL